jgi:glycerol transport system ATP-binding protein
VRNDVNVIMFDEPLTVIDPHLKWRLRSKLKELHQRVRRTMIYVTHDQTEALTFADRVVVMHDGLVVQQGTPVELFERPSHTFVGHFIGSPGMNFMPCRARARPAPGGGAAGGAEPRHRSTEPAQHAATGGAPRVCPVRRPGLAVEVDRVSDTGRYRIVETRLAGNKVRVLVPEGQPVPEGRAHLHFDPRHTQVYADGWIIS